jgi:hypothetical protein
MSAVPLRSAPLRTIRHREVLANRERLYLACGHAIERRYADYASRARCIECLTELPQTGGDATTTAEARGTGSSSADSRRERNGRANAARAAGAQLTGQCQSGPSSAPARQQYPGGAHGTAGPTFNTSGSTDPGHPGLTSSPPSRGDLTPPNAAPPTQGARRTTLAGPAGPSLHNDYVIAHAVAAAALNAQGRA